MQLSVIGRQIDIGDAFRQHIEGSLKATFSKYFGDPIEATVTLSRHAHLYHARLAAHVGRNMQLAAEAEADKPYAAFDLAADRLAKRLRRHKRRLRDNHSSEGGLQSLPARAYVLAAEEEGEDETGAETAGEEVLDHIDGGPAVIAEMATEIPDLTVSQAVMRMDLADQPAILFRNSAHGGLNMVYRRSDGNIGWVDPDGNAANGR